MAVPLPFKRPEIDVVSVIAGVVVALATVPAKPFAETTDTLETVPELLALIVWFGQVPVIVTLVPATKEGLVDPVPPLVTGKAVPEYPMASVPEVVIGLPEMDKNDGTVAATEVTVPPGLLEFIVWFGQVPVMVTLVPATNAGVAVPVPPLFTFNTPLSVTSPVEAVDGVNPVVPALNEVTPPAAPFEAAVMRPCASTVKLVLV
jgi:hypothetical protein